MFLSGGGHVEDFRGRGSCIGLDCAVCRDDRGLGAADSPALRCSQTSPTPWGKAGRRVGMAPSAGTHPTPGITIEWRVGPSARPAPPQASDPSLDDAEAL